MVKSMTGYGRGEAVTDGFRFIVEMKAVNHRHFDLVIRASRDLLPLEDKIRRMLLEKISRGRIEVFITLETTQGKGKLVNLDEELALSYFQCLQKLRTSFNLLQKELTAEELALFPDVLYIEKNAPDLELLAPVLEEAVSRALSALIRQRTEEGNRLRADILERVKELERITGRIQERGPHVLEEYRNKLSARLNELHAGREYDEQRFFMEIALFAERCNIDEEIVRMKSHLEIFSQDIQTDGVIGRKLDFLLQEMNREVNTIASKSSDLEISYLVVEAKSEIEKIREQVQNIE
ncbi:MAG TPA: YicC family protein [Firmicutes bacterium]|nr:YicC family protein [Bacillota bacterium]